MTASASHPPGDPTPLFTWFRRFAVEMRPRDMRDRVKDVALLIALDCKGTTGGWITIKYGEIAEALGVSERTIWRHVRRLVEDGWLVQVEKPRRGERRGEKGLTAKYQLSLPQRLTQPAEGVAHDAPADDSPNVCHNSPERLPQVGLTSATAEREGGTVPPSDAPPSDAPPPRPRVPNHLDTRARETDCFVCGLTCRPCACTPPDDFYAEETRTA